MIYLSIYLFQPFKHFLIDFVCLKITSMFNDRCFNMFRLSIGLFAYV